MAEDEPGASCYCPCEVPRAATLKICASYLPLLPGIGGSFEYQITRYRPVAWLLMWNVTAPVGLFAVAIVVIESRFCLLRASELPTRTLTTAPGSELNVTVTVVNLAGWPMSIRRPEPAL